MVYCNLNTTKKHRNENKAGLLNLCLANFYKPKVGTVSFIHMPKADIILTVNGLLQQKMLSVARKYVESFFIRYCKVAKILKT